MTNFSTTTSKYSCTNNFLRESEYIKHNPFFRQRFLLENLYEANDPYEMFRSCVLRCVEIGIQKAVQLGIEPNSLIVSAFVAKKVNFVVNYTARIHLKEDPPEALVEKFLNINKCKPGNIYYNTIAITLKVGKLPDSSKDDANTPADISPENCFINKYLN